MAEHKGFYIFTRRSCTLAAGMDLAAALLRCEQRKNGYFLHEVCTSACTLRFSAKEKRLC